MHAGICSVLIWWPCREKWELSISRDWMLSDWLSVFFIFLILCLKKGKLKVVCVSTHAVFSVFTSLSVNVLLKLFSAVFGWWEKKYFAFGAPVNKAPNQCVAWVWGERFLLIWTPLGQPAATGKGKAKGDQLSTDCLFAHGILQLHVFIQ